MDVPGGGRKRVLEFACVARGYSNDADVNAALNILALGTGPQDVERACTFGEASRGMWSTPARVARGGESHMQVPMYGGLARPRSMIPFLS